MNHIQHASLTAEIMAMHRALENLRPKAERVCHDPYAAYFVNPLRAMRLKSPWHMWFREWMMNLFFPGVNGAIVARVRFIDDFLVNCLDHGMEQLVILGAGYDTRAYRFEALKEKAIVFEVDHPETQQAKLDKLRLIFNGGQEHVVHVPLDLKHDPLNERLYESGFDQRKITLFILEGLVMYLPPPVVDQIFGFISGHSGTGSAMVFDCLPASIVDGSIQAREGRAMYRFVRRHGEPFAFGLNADHLEAFLVHRNFHHIHRVNAVDCKSAYFRGRSRQRKVSPIFSFVHASVRPSGDDNNIKV